MTEAVAAAAAAAMETTEHHQPALTTMMSEENFSATAALVAFLRMEADIAEEKAKRLRDQATLLAQQFGVSDALQEAYGECCTVGYSRFRLQDFLVIYQR
jgi:hypothetical protein